LATLHPIHRSMGVSRSASMVVRSRAGAEKASLTPSNKPICKADEVDEAISLGVANGTVKPVTGELQNPRNKSHDAKSVRVLMLAISNIQYAFVSDR
jgi:hypothetical protein